MSGVSMQRRIEAWRTRVYRTKTRVRTTLPGAAYSRQLREIINLGNYIAVGTRLTIYQFLIFIPNFGEKI